MEFLTYEIANLFQSLQKNLIKNCRNYKIEPQYCIFFEDIARNLKPAYELEMKTVWIKMMNLGQQNILTQNLSIIELTVWQNFLKEINELR